MVWRSISLLLVDMASSESLFCEDFFGKGKGAAGGVAVFARAFRSAQVRLMIESRWSQLARERQRLWIPPRANHQIVWRARLSLGAGPAPGDIARRAGGLARRRGHAAARGHELRAADAHVASGVSYSG
eukprot:COSAG01_NODE_1543_length_9973_cov_3.152015_10_plen_129_part_00